MTNAERDRLTQLAEWYRTLADKLESEGLTGPYWTGHTHGAAATARVAADKLKEIVEELTTV